MQPVAKPLVRTFVDRIACSTAMVTVIICQACGNPDLTPAKAGEIIARTPEFNISRTLVAVKSTTRSTGSDDSCCHYYADFAFRDKKVPLSANVIDGQAEFRFWERAWHLQVFWYGRPPAVTGVHIQSDVPKKLFTDDVP